MTTLMRGTLIALALLLVPAAPAAAQSTDNRIYRDCNDGSLDGTYTPAEIRHARENMPSDVAEYTDCASLLRKAELDPATPDPTAPAGDSGGAPPAGAPEPTPPPELVPETPGDQAALDGAAAGAAQPITVGGKPVLAGIAATTQLTHPLPGPVLAALILLGLAGLALCLPPLRRRLGPLRRRR